ncbi:hypothetical protein NPIL_258621 [Nephila pilipes]|uniref:Uncharacterized protein n=1 Tax=Nephila pilipes TaxID=299642 RepID=A0A8X6QGL0_NEPPI|nr:hypothetical protein NPIL_258621 [Nephila pilipes]
MISFSKKFPDNLSSPNRVLCDISWFVMDRLVQQIGNYFKREVEMVAVFDVFRSQTFQSKSLGTYFSRESRQFPKVTSAEKKHLPLEKVRKFSRSSEDV